MNVAAMRGRPGEREEVDLAGSLDELATSGAQVDPTSEVSFQGTLEAIEGHRIVAVGDVHATWSGECRRCLGEARGDIEARVHEIFEDDAVEGETYALDGQIADLEQLIREAIMLEIPVAPVCKPGCKGLCPDCGANRNTAPCDCIADLSDPRWAALDVFSKDGES